jgi:hypothetical protein
MTFIEALLGSIIIGGAVGVGAGISAFIPLFAVAVALTITTIDKFDKMMLKTHKGRIKKLQKKAIELRDKAKEKRQNEIASNCQKLIDAIDKYYKDLDDKKFRERVNTYKKTYKKLVDIIHSKSYMEEPDIIYFRYADALGISKNRINKGQANCDMYYDTKEVLSAFYGETTIEGVKKEGKYDDYLKLCNIIPELKTPEKGKVNIYYAIDDTIFLYSKISNLFVYGGYSVDEAKWNSDISVLANNTNTYEDYKIDKEILKIADAELGYYLLSEPPEGETRKKI